jgi:hypothetical protein
MKIEDFILETFLRLTNRTWPYGTEDILAEELIEKGIFPQGIQKDIHGNYFYKIGNSKTVFTSHLDTACKEHTPVNHVIEGDLIKSDGTTILGADDKAGMTIMLWMISQGVTGLYYFFIGEEVGCIGSGIASKNWLTKEYDRMISFDRRGTGSVITHQSSQRCCSDEFAKKLSSELSSLGLNYKPDDTGVYTDSAEFVDIISECTNISVGYYKEHTHTENQDINHLTKLAQACCFVKWEELPTVRDPKKSEYKSWSYSNDRSYYGGTKTWRDSRWDRTYERGSKKKRNHKKDFGYYDDWYDQTPMQNRSSLEGKEYVDLGNGDFKLITPVKKHNTGYDWMIDMFSESVTMEELETIKEQYLDMENSQDQLYYSFLLSSVKERLTV